MPISDNFVRPKENPALPNPDKDKILLPFLGVDIYAVSKSRQ